MDKSPLVSVIIPVYNCENYLSEAIKSVHAQTYAPLEIIVINDGSTDNSAVVAQHFSPSVNLYSFENSGAGAARNQGVELASGDFLAFLDADDLWVEKKLSLQMKAFDHNPDLDMVFGHVKQFFSPDLDKKIQDHIKIPSEILPGHHVGTMLIKKESFLKVGPFATTWELGEFVDWYARARELKLYHLMLNDVVMKRRIHENNQGRYKRAHTKDYLRVLKATLDRRKGKKE